jgi:hypothetical protein
MIDAHELADAGVRYRTAASLLPAQVREQLARLQPRVEEAGVAAIAAATPGSQGADSLAATTTPISTNDGTSLSLLILQTKMVHSLRQNKDFSLARILIDGRRALEGADRITPFTKAALFWEGAPGGHPWRSVEQPERPPHPYPEEATPTIASTLTILAQRWGDAIFRAALEMS